MTSPHDEMVTVRCLVPVAIKNQLEAVCAEQRQRNGLHYAQTMAACLVIGVRALSRSGSISHLILDQVRI